MPFYSFRCEECLTIFEQMLKMGQKPEETPCCHSKNFTKLVSKPNISGMTEIEKASKRLNEFAQKAKESLEETKKELNKKR